LYIADIINPMPTRKRKDEGVFIRLSAVEKEAIQTAANHDERTLADWLRRLARHKLRELGLLSEPEKKPKKKES
jgi:4-alpha-glucanotransferase